MTEGSERYWESRWRDADKEIKRLELIHEQLKEQFVLINNKLDEIAKRLRTLGI